jgi:hypothetical protein
MGNDSKNLSMSFTVSQALKDDIETLTEQTGAESRSEFLRNCVYINKLIADYAKKGFAEIVLQKPGGDERVFLHLGNVVKDKGYN